MRNFSIIFAVTSPTSNLLNTICSRYFYGYTKAVICKDKRLSIHNGLLHSCCNLTLASRGAIAFLIYYTLIFHFMPKSNENASMLNNSKHTTTSVGTKTGCIKINPFTFLIDELLASKQEVCAFLNLSEKDVSSVNRTDYYDASLNNFREYEYSLYEIINKYETKIGIKY